MAARAIYADYNAAAPVRPEAAAAVARGLALGGNASSVHAAGRRARAEGERARAVIAGALGVEARNLVFTGGGTEACNLMILGAVDAGVDRLIVGALEHDAVYAAAQEARRRGAAVETLPATPAGVIDLDALAARLAGGPHPSTLVALMLAQNETGAIQPVAEAGALARAAGALLAVDAVQAFGKTPVDLDRLGAHYLAVSSHKIGGPPGVGALALAVGAPLAARAHGGGQELGRRSGTLNLAGVMGFAAAAEAAVRDLPAFAGLARLRDRLAGRLEAAGATVVAADAPRLANTLCVALPGLRAETVVMALDLAGVMASAGAACSSGKVAASRALAAMGLPAGLAEAAVRISFGWATQEEEADHVADALLAVAARARRPAPALA